MYFTDDGFQKIIVYQQAFIIVDYKQLGGKCIISDWKLKGTYTT